MPPGGGALDRLYTKSNIRECQWNQLSTTHQVNINFGRYRASSSILLGEYQHADAVKTPFSHTSDFTAEVRWPHNAYRINVIVYKRIVFDHENRRHSLVLLL